MGKQEQGRNLKICIEVFQEKFGPKAKEVTVSQGDDGIDILVGELTDSPSVYQCKFLLMR